MRLVLSRYPVPRQAGFWSAATRRRFVGGPRHWALETPFGLSHGFRPLKTSKKRRRVAALQSEPAQFGLGLLLSVLCRSSYGTTGSPGLTGLTGATGLDGNA
jgi:hypothetical protein